MESELPTEDSVRIERENRIFFGHETERMFLLEVEHRAKMNDFETVDDLPNEFWEDPFEEDA